MTVQRLLVPDLFVLLVYIKESTEIDRQIKSITNLLWGELDTPLIDRTVGNGKIVYGKNIDQILSEKK